MALKKPVKKTVSRADAKQPEKVTRADGWMNLLTGLGTLRKDKRMGMTIAWTPLKEKQVEDLYSQDDIAAKVVDKIPDEGLREWIEFKNIDDEKLVPLNDYIDRIKLISSLKKAWKWARLYGGAAIFMDVDDGQGDYSQPLNLNGVNSIKALTVLHRYELIAGTDIDPDISSPNYGLPITYQLSSRFSGGENNIKIHFSRLVRFEGTELPRQNFISNQYWGDSVLTRTYNALSNFNMTNDSIAAIMGDFRQSVLKMQNLADLVAANKEDQIKQRIELANLSRSVLGTLLLSDKEEFTNLSTPIAGLSELAKIGYDRLQAATDMPHTILFGEGSAGSTSGRSEKRDFYDTVANLQETVLTEPINKLLGLIFAASDGPTVGQKLDYGWDFKALWQMELSEEAAVRKTIAETDAIYIQQGVFDATEIMVSRTTQEGINFNVIVDLEERQSLAPNPAPAPATGAI